MAATPPHAERDDLPYMMTLDEVADLLRLGKDGVRGLIDSGELATVRLGARTIRVTREDLLDLIERSRTRHAKPEQPE